MLGGKFSGRQNAALQMVQKMEVHFIESVSFSNSITRQALPPQYKTVEDFCTKGPKEKIAKSHFDLRALCSSSTGPCDDIRHYKFFARRFPRNSPRDFTKEQASNPS
jgi:hypothetical protein